MSENTMLVLNRDDLESLGLTWKEIIDVLEDAFQQKARGLVQNPPKPKVASRDDAFIHAMPAYLGGSDRIGLKWVAGYEQNAAKGLPYIYGVMIMNDAETGRPIAMLDGVSDLLAHDLPLAFAEGRDASLRAKLGAEAAVAGRAVRARIRSSRKARNIQKSRDPEKRAAAAAREACFCALPATPGKRFARHRPCAKSRRQRRRAGKISNRNRHKDRSSSRFPAMAPKIPHCVGDDSSS